MSDYDMSIHHNPSGAAWAKFFMEMKNKVNFEIDEDLMLGWFCNAMEARSNYEQKEIDSLKTQLAEAEKALTEIRNLDWGTDHCDAKNMVANKYLKKYKETK
jgi:hypothetical protein